MSTDDESKINALIEMSHRHLDKNRRLEAAGSAESALELAEAAWGSDDARLVPILALLGECVREPRFGVHDDKPLPHLLRAIRISLAASPPDRRTLAGLYRQTGLAYTVAADLKSARDLLSQAVDLFKQLGDMENASFCLGALASAVLSASPADALPMCHEWVELEGELSPRSTSHYTALVQLERCLIQLGKHSEALNVLFTIGAMAEGGSSIPGLDAEIARVKALISGK